MKPIVLKVSGLQSYREVQEIDFEQLCETGLFGIFGPTGSGKSTLLDAITLAMYGKVERAQNGTQGIMNHSEDSLYVSFTFELASAEGAERYRVERRFKRMNELSVSNAVSRFVRIAGEEELVIADKLADVTRCVEEKIGLKMDDFTRAVVLPQGKFAEFLSLKGSERRQMLQRLFHLERYGDQLAQKLSRRVKENEGALRAVEAEQQGLGIAGKEAVAEAEKALSAAELHAQETRSRLEAAIQQNESLSKLRELDAELRRLKQHLNELSAREDELKALEHKLELAGYARQLLPVQEARKESAERHASLKQRAAGLQQAADEAEKDAIQLAEADETARKELASEEPALLSRADQLEQAVILQREREVLSQELAKLSALRNEARDKMQTVTEQLSKEQELLERGLKRRQELEESLKLLEVRAQDRQALQEAMQKKQSILGAETQLTKYEAEAREQQRVNAKADEQIRETRQQASSVDHELMMLSREGEQLRQAAADAVKLSEQGAAHAVSLIRGLNLDARQQELHALSLSLAADLSDGKPCPVCGSLHHPEPALPEAAASTDDADRRLKQVEAMQEELQELRLQFRQLLNEGVTLPVPKDNVNSLIAVGQQSSNREWEEITSSLSEAAAGILVDDNQKLEDDKLDMAVSSLRAFAAGLSEAAAKFRSSVHLVQEKQSSIQKDLARKEASQEHNHARLVQLNDRVNTAQKELAGLKEAWYAAAGSLDYDSLEQQLAGIREKDDKAEAVREGLERSVPFLEEKKKASASLELQLRELEKQLIQWDAQHQGKQELLLEKDGRLRAWIGNESAEELLTSCRQRLKYLKDTAAQTAERSKKAEERKQLAAREAAIAGQAAHSAGEHAALAERRWTTDLSTSPFSSEEELLNASMPPEEMEKSRHLLQDHRDKQKEWSLRLNDVEQKLDGKIFSEEAWQECCRSLDEGRSADESAIQMKARAQRDLEDIRTRHIRFMELEKHRIQHARESERLSKLQSCLRGNAFVEYIAEEQLMQVSQAASQRLRYLTQQRYSLEVDSGGGFVIRDDANGGVRRPVSTLSGGETFLTSLSLALALSAQIQLRGQYPLQFFFLDEGFGTLDPELLDTVITSLERLHNDKLTVGIISHVPELRARLPRKLVITPAGQAGGGSKIMIEKM
ncbi:SbcC/MukB-like Walker B domain-containing protein [Paenibacillus lemnae]|uniref:Nuclease SbcCD subunit C n=1 Tax=Paenibacillus lemnae TaxID=1330551 RepID=A0A848M1U2_PAELE|nr:SMC family ATPase [Paenibacillus lemnae]NMO94837.1 SMC family ATPase [Paenibacillus lemnae]